MCSAHDWVGLLSRHPLIVVEEVDDLLDAVIVQVEAQTLEQGSQLGHLDVGIAVAVDEARGEKKKESYAVKKPRKFLD